MSGFGLNFTDLSNATIPPLIRLETHEMKHMNSLANDQIKCAHKQRRLYFKDDRTTTTTTTSSRNDFTESTERTMAGRDADSKLQQNKPQKTIESLKPKQPPLPVRMLTGAVSGLARAYNAIALHSCCTLSPPTGIINTIAFYPPAPWRYYYLSYFNEERNERAFGNAKQCYDKLDLRIEPVTRPRDPVTMEHLEGVMRRTKPFIVHSESKNYLVAGKIEARLEEWQQPSNKVILVANSNACDIGLTVVGEAGYIASYEHPNEYDVYFFDYSGYGLSSGKPTEAIVYKDIESVYDYIVDERKDPLLEIILFGVSIGSAVVTDLASKNLPFITGVILVAPLTSVIRHIAGNKPPKKTSTVDCFRTLDKAPSVRVPLLCIHGLKDEMMPPRNSAEIYAVAPFGVDPLFVPNRCHLGVLSSYKVGERITTFIEDDIEKWKKGCKKFELSRSNEMKYEEYEFDRDSESSLKLSSNSAIDSDELINS